MKKKIILFLVVLLAFTGCTKSKDNDIQVSDNKEPTTKIEKAISDLDYLVGMAEKIHPDLYIYTDKEEFAKEAELIKSKFKEGTQLEFYQLVAPLFASLNDGVTEIDPLGNYFTSAIENGGNFFPYQIEVNDGKFIVKSCYIGDEQVLNDSEILKINGLSTEEIYTNLIRYTSGISVYERERELTKVFHRLYYMIYGDSEKFTVDISYGSESKTAEVDAANMKNVILQELPENKTYSYKRVKDGVGLITIYKFDGFSGFKRFMEATTINLKNENIESLIIDISDNIGGNPEFSKYIMSFITDEPFRLYGDIKAKISMEVSAKDTFMQENYSDRIGEVVSAEFNDETRPFEDLVPFAGDVYLLIGDKTFSVSSELAALIKTYEAAVLVGTETASNASSFKVPFQLTSRYLNIGFKIPYRHYIDAGGIDEKKGVTPDIIVKENVLEYVLDMISK